MKNQTAFGGNLHHLVELTSIVLHPEPLDQVGSVFQCRSFVEPFEENQPLGEFFVGRRSEEPIKIVHTEVTDDLFTAVTRHAYSTTATSITSPTHYRAPRRLRDSCPKLR